MKKMKPESVIKICQLKGVKIFVEDGDICVQGGGCHNWDNSHWFWKLMKIHYSDLCKHFGVKE